MKPSGIVSSGGNRAAMASISTRSHGSSIPRLTHVLFACLLESNRYTIHKLSQSRVCAHEVYSLSSTEYIPCSRFSVRRSSGSDSPSCKVLQDHQHIQSAYSVSALAWDMQRAQVAIVSITSIRGRQTSEFMDYASQKLQHILSLLHRLLVSLP